MAENNTTKYETQVTLPSLGLLYEGTIPESITLRAMTTNEEKMMYGSSVDTLDNIIKSCIVEPQSIDMNELLTADEKFLLIKLRAHTYGSDYPLIGRCPFCGSSEEYMVDLDSLNCIYLDKKYTEPVEFQLPISQDIISVKLFRKKDADYVSTQSKKIAESTGGDAKEIAYILRMARFIKKINGKEIDSGSAQKYVESMVGKDSSYFWNKVNHLAVFGLDNYFTVKCKSCGQEYKLPFAINSEFFRTRYSE